jgi:DNA-binding MarR family transcriptional regulator
MTAHVELRHLRAFVALAQEPHLTRAAERLHLAQQAVSAQIRQLEHELGTALFVRTTRRVELTDDGRTLLSHAEPLLGALTTALEQTVRAGARELGRSRSATRPVGRGIWCRQTSFSIWQYSRSRPAKWASQRPDASPVRRKSSAMSSKRRSKPCASMPITRMPWAVSQSVDSRVIPGCSKYSRLPRKRSRPVISITMSSGLSR